MAMEKFHFTHDGNDFALPYVPNIKTGLSVGLIEAMENKKESQILRSVFAIALKEDSKVEEAIKDMDTPEFTELMKNWMESTPGTSGK